MIIVPSEPKCETVIDETVVERKNIELPTPEPVKLPELTADDVLLIKKARSSINQLQIEIKTLDGFVSDYIGSKYNLKDQLTLMDLLNTVQ